MAQLKYLRIGHASHDDSDAVSRPLILSMIYGYMSAMKCAERIYPRFRIKTGGSREMGYVYIYLTLNGGPDNCSFILKRRRR